MIKFDIENRVAVVTGGAQGFGLAITERFIESGAKVVICLLYTSPSPRD